MSAIRKLIPWFMAIGIPNWTRSFEYWAACSKAARATPTAPIAVPGRVKSRVRIAILKPSPSSPRRLATGTRTSWKASAEVSVERWPILSRCFSTTTPSASAGTTNAVRPRCFFDLSVEANTVNQAAWPALVMNIFEPLRMYSSPFLTAVVWIPETSEPAFGSVRANEVSSGSSTSGGSHARFCSSVPAMTTGPWPRPLATIAVPIPEQPQQSSSPTSRPSKPPSSRPPYASGMCRFISPSSWALARMSAGCVECSSYSRSFGRISFSANSCARSRSAFCSSESPNETPAAVVCSIVATLVA